ncbi:MAG TPA: glycine betaine ABC transporter substrate-binding protein [Burkholderiales bacterium]|nr:glycine betaine ABC transporter substrate-binding protein [Burkholderiales bacterium]
MKVRALCFFLLLVAPGVFAQATLNVGSKRFTESYILGEILAQTASHAEEAKVIHKQGLGNTGILFAALQSGSIDIYPEYSGTIWFELLKKNAAGDLAALNHELAPLGLAAGVPLGFNNTYALAMRDARAALLGISGIGDMAYQPGLRLGLSQEFLNRKDGWPLLKSAYSLPFEPLGLDHGLAYEALAEGKIDVMDIYSTDAKIAKYRLRVLNDNQHVFPSYDALLLYRGDLPRRFPKSWMALEKLQGRISARQMAQMNAEAELEGRTFSAIAADFLASGTGPKPDGSASKNLLKRIFAADFWRLTAEHLLLVFVSLGAAIVLGIPLGVCAAHVPAVRQPILSVVGVIQTLPSLALLAFLISMLGTIGVIPALIALFLYALLPIVRNTHVGIADIQPSLSEAAQSLGLPFFARLRLIEMPLASRAILGGIKTSAVINVGTATIAAFVGAGGYGERIVQGLALNDTATMLAGAIPAAALALLLQGGFELLDRWLIPGGLRAATSA